MEKLIFVAIGLVFGSISAWYFSKQKYQDENIDLEEIEEKFNVYEKTIEELTARVQHQEELGLEKDQSITEFRTKYTQVQDSYEDYKEQVDSYKGLIQRLNEEKGELLQIKAIKEQFENQINLLKEEKEDQHKRLGIFSTEREVLLKEKAIKDELQNQIQLLRTQYTGEVKSLNDKIDSLNIEKEELMRIKTIKDEVVKQNSEMTSKMRNYESEITDLNSQVVENETLRVAAMKLSDETRGELNLSKDQIKDLEKKLERLTEQNESRQKGYDEKMATFQSAINARQEEEQRLREEREKLRKEEFDAMKKTWRTHEVNIENFMRDTCIKNQIEYLEDFPGNKNPDNVIRVADQMVVFDAKSPANDNLDNFPKYIKEQAINLKKYLVGEDVRREMFLVVPDNCLHVIKSFYIPFPDYMVYVISESSLVPVMLTLKRIEEYEFAETLSPEDRANVVSYVGKATHLLKRRVQVDNFFSKSVFSLIDHQDILPEEFLEESQKIEKASNLNPPMERGKKSIPIAKLAKESSKVEKQFVEAPLEVNPYGFKKTAS
ncbi:MAG: hypothetical protein KC493_16515 [Bacteriovoracaceae bacterium]|nr:hypothetical protein [Bacteriovoracaceae bacterium]